MAPKKNFLSSSFSFLFPPKREKKEAFRSFFLSFFRSSPGVPSSLFFHHHHHHRAGRQDFYDGKAHHLPAMMETRRKSNRCISIEIGRDERDFFFNARERRQVERRAFDRFQKHTPPTKRKWIDEASGVSSSSSSSKRKIKKKEQRSLELTTRRRRSTSSPNRSRSLVLLI